MLFITVVIVVSIVFHTFWIVVQMLFITVVIVVHMVFQTF